jgi:hypothetical protein
MGARLQRMRRSTLKTTTVRAGLNAACKAKRLIEDALTGASIRRDLRLLRKLAAA